MKDNTALLLGLEDVIVKNVSTNDTEEHIEVELPRRTHPRKELPEYQIKLLIEVLEQEDLI